MADATEDSPQPTPHWKPFASVLREFGVTVALSFLSLLALLYTAHYHLLVFLRTSTPPCTPTPTSYTCRVAHDLAALRLAPLEVLKVTTVCAVGVFLGMELVVRVCGSVRVFSRRGLRNDDVEMGAARGERINPGDMKAVGRDVSVL
ncbi:hypothetical protein B0H11DRAFT_2208780 [Mycena galericulata]|nr:hypothetical protein B0H11DRAFT_2208780 [Mycena galericulata]